jgi:formylmethanofuran dehydrogenase subunit E
MPSDGSGWCDECGHLVGIGHRLSYEVDGRMLCERCVDTDTEREGQP